MPEQPLVSIIVPIYNAQDHIARCVESIRRQTYKNIEILLLNDGSQDVSLQVCEMYARVEHRIVLIDKANSGVAATATWGCAGQGQVSAVCGCGRYHSALRHRNAGGSCRGERGRSGDRPLQPASRRRARAARPAPAPSARPSADLRLFAGGCHDERGVCRRA